MSNGSNEPDGSQGHPAWQAVLDVIPESLHSIVKPQLMAMDNGVQQKLQELHGSYDPYRKFVDSGIDPNVLEQSLYLANQLRTDPESFVTRAIENFKLQDKFGPQQQYQSEEEEWDGEDISKHPAFKVLTDRIEQLQTTQQTWEQEREEQTAQEQLDEYLDSMEQQHGEFDRLYVASLMANNVEAPTAIKQYQDMVNNAALKLTNGTPPADTNSQTPQNGYQQAPVVMGAAGTAGSGSPAEPVQMGDLKPGEVQDLVLQMLEQAAKNE